MSNRFRKFDCSVVSPTKYELLAGPALWLVKSVASEAMLEAVIDGVERGLFVDHRQAILITCVESAKIVSRSGAWRFQKVPLYEAAKLLAFLECSTIKLGQRVEYRENFPSSECAIVVPPDLTIWKFERWLIGRVMNPSRDDLVLFDFLRAQETYSLVRFLLGERSSVTTVAALSERYGVSTSHFRRLCKQALGKGLKRELRQWRAAMAVLDVVEGRESMTDLAMSHGFASSSHFSREIKDLFGFSPCRLRRKDKDLHDEK